MMVCVAVSLQSQNRFDFDTIVMAVLCLNLFRDIREAKREGKDLV